MGRSLRSLKQDSLEGDKGAFLELHEAAKKWELLTYHLQVICHENCELGPLLALDSDIYLKREEAYLMVSLILKMYKHMGLVMKQHADYKAFQSFLSTIFQGLVKRKISPAMVYHWLTPQMYWALCQYQINDTQLDVLLLYREFSPSAKPPYETDPGMFHHMPELHDQEQLLGQVEMSAMTLLPDIAIASITLTIL